MNAPDTNTVIAKIMQYVEDIMIKAEADYPAGREAGCRISYDSDAIEKFIASCLLSLVEERDRLREALELAAEDFRTIKTLNSHGASDQTYIGWLRSNAEQGERRARRALTGDTT